MKMEAKREEGIKINYLVEKGCVLVDSFGSLLGTDVIELLNPTDGAVLFVDELVSANNAAFGFMANLRRCSGYADSHFQLTERN